MTSSKALSLKVNTILNLGLLDDKISAPELHGGTESGLYMGITGFNTALTCYPIGLLNAQTKQGYESFVDGLTMKNGTILYYSVNDAVNQLKSAICPSDIYNVALVTFTDGLDRGTPMKVENYPGNDAYRSLLHQRITTESIAGLPMTAWAIGLMGQDVDPDDEEFFYGNLNAIATSSTNVFKVKSMGEVNSRFQEIANHLNETSFLQKVTIEIPGEDNGTLIRITLDGASSAESSSKYIEGTFNLSNRSLTNITYHGIKSKSGNTVAGHVYDEDGVMVTFAFDDIVNLDGVLIQKQNISEWLFLNNKWRPNSEYDPNKHSTLVKIKRSAMVLLNLDCSTSLGNDFSTLKAYAKSFISTLCEATIDKDAVASVSLDKTSLSLKEGQSIQLTATVSPASAFNKDVTWRSSNPEIAFVSGTGLVRAITPGQASIIVTTDDGGYTASCVVSVTSVPKAEAVDLGLSVKWASFNVGATSPDDYGDYFAWGETQPKNNYAWSTLQWYGGYYNLQHKFTKYCPSDRADYWYGSDSPDNKIVLDHEDDAAYANWGGSWRMPTDAEWSELIENCTWNFTSNYNGTGIAGTIVTSKKTGYIGKSIFLPAAGHISDGLKMVDVGGAGSYWSSSLNMSGNPDSASGVTFNSSEVMWNYFYPYYPYYRYYGFSVRPVISE